MTFIERLHSKIYPLKFFKLFTWFTRILLAIAFMPSGYIKITGNRFTLLPVENPVGFFFEAMYQTGWYWNFLGFMQLLVALLLLIPRTSFFASILYLPIIINIFFIVSSMGFIGTPFVTGLMLLGNLYVMLWDWDKLKRIVSVIFEH